MLQSSAPGEVGAEDWMPPEAPVGVICRMLSYPFAFNRIKLAVPFGPAADCCVNRPCCTSTSAVERLRGAEATG